jgi:cytochrome c553
MKPMRIRNVVALLITALAAMACSKSEPAGGSASTGKGNAALTENSEAKTVFETRCVLCHGKEGKGDGTGAVSLNPKPRNYSDKEWQKTVTDEEIKKTIVEGGVGVGKSPFMTPNPDLKDKPEVLEGLVKIIRGFAS